MVSGSAKSFVRGLRAAYEDAFKVPADVAKAAARGLEMRESQPPSKRGGTAVGVARARDLKGRKALSKATIKRMVSFFARHRDPESSSSKTRGDGASEAKQADLLWGGSAGKRWANGIKRQLEAKGEYSDEDQATPAPPNDRIKGSDRNPKGSAKAAGGIDLGARTEKALRGKARNHNMRMDEPWQKTTAGALEAVWRRGAGAYSTSHRPGVSRAAWAMARVNAFLHLLRTGKPKDPKYKSDNDLLPRDHPRKTGRGAGGQYVEATSSIYADEDGGRWITIGAKPDKDGKKKGGTPVYIKGGKITKGPSALKGKALNNLSGEAEQPKETPAPEPKPAATEEPAKEEKASPPPTKDINKISDTLENTALASSYGLIMKTWEKGDRKRIYIKRRLSKGMQDVGYIDIDKRGRVSYESQRINSVIRKLSGWAEELIEGRFSEDVTHYAEGRWITIGARSKKGGDKDGPSGGAHVFIQNGKVTKGPSAVKGKSLASIDGGKPKTGMAPKAKAKIGAQKIDAENDLMVSRGGKVESGPSWLVGATISKGGDPKEAAKRAKSEGEFEIGDGYKVSRLTYTITKTPAGMSTLKGARITSKEGAVVKRLRDASGENKAPQGKPSIKATPKSAAEPVLKGKLVKPLKAKPVAKARLLSRKEKAGRNIRRTKARQWRAEREGRSRGMRGVLEMARSLFADDIDHYVDDDQGRWITIGSVPSTDEKTGKTKNKGGTPVFITKDGRIAKGPASLKGRKIGKLDKDIPPESAKGDRRKALEKAFLALKAGQSSKDRKEPEAPKAKEPEAKTTQKEAAPSKGDGMTVRPGGKTVKGKYGPAIIKKVGQFDVKVEVNNPDGSRRPKEERDAEALRRGQEKSKRFAAKMRREAPKKAEEPKESKAPNKTESVNSDAPRESKINLSPEDKSEADRLRGEIAKINEKISPLASSVTKKDDIWRSFDKGKVGFQRASLARKRERELSRTIDSSVKATKLIAERERLESKLSFIESGKAAQRREDMALRKAKREPKGKRNIDPIKAASLKAWRGVMSGSKARLDDGSVVDYEPRETPEGITFDLVLTRSDGTKVKTDPGDTYKTRQKAFRSLVESHLSSSQDSGKSSGDDGPAKSTPKKDEETKKPEPAKLPEFPKERTKENIDEWIKQTSTVGKGLPSARRRKLPSDEKKVTPDDVKEVIAKKAKRERRPFDDPEDMRAINKRLDMIAQGVRRKAARDSARRAGRKTFAAILTAYREAAA